MTGSDTPWRLFIAFPMPPAAASTLVALLQPYVRAFPTARWQRADAYHVTARFLGGTSPSLVPDLMSEMAACAATGRPIPMATGVAGGNPRATGGVAWLTLDRGGPESGAMSRCLEAVAPGRPSAPPHLTIARRVDAPLIAAMASEALGPLRVSWTADRLVLYRSHTGTPAGSRYEPLGEVPL